MNTARAKKKAAKGYVWLAAELRRAVESGQIQTGSRLPPARRLAAEHGVSTETARRAGKLLEREGLVAAQARHGFTVLSRSNDPDRGLPIAFVISDAEKTQLWSEFHLMLFACLQRAAAERGWSVLAVGTGRRSGREILEQLRDCRVCGMVLDSLMPDLLAEVERVKLPTVLMDAWDPELRMDAVVQDSFQGGLLATRYLIGRGHRRIAWLGQASQSWQSRERFGGFCAGLIGSEAEFLPEFMQDTPWAQMPAVARALLARSDRPTAVLGLWCRIIEEWVKAAAELGLAIGRDVELVGWTGDEGYDGAYRALFGGAGRPATVVWSMAQLARASIARLVERRRNPDAPPVLTKILTRLLPPETKEVRTL